MRMAAAPGHGLTMPDGVAPIIALAALKPSTCVTGMDLP